MASIAYRILKVESMIKKLIVANRTFFTSITFSRIDPFAYINSLVIGFIRTNLNQCQNDCHQDNLTFACLQFYKHNCLNILPSNISFLIPIKNQ